MFKLIKFLSPYKGKVTIMLILLFLQVLGTLYIPTLTADIVNNGIVKGDLDYVFRTGGLMLAVAVLIALVSISESYFSTSIFAWMAEISEMHCLGSHRHLRWMNLTVLVQLP